MTKRQYEILTEMLSKEEAAIRLAVYESEGEWDEGLLKEDLNDTIQIKKEICQTITIQESMFKKNDDQAI